MERAFPKRIHIIGSVGSGKTTLAKELSARLQIPYYELDNVVRERFETGDIMRTAEKRDAHLIEIVNTDSWIIEGVHYKWVSPSFQNAGLIIFLDIGMATRRCRIIKRFFLQKAGLEGANYKPTLKVLKNLYNYNTVFEYERKSKVLEMLKPYESKLVILKSNAEIMDYFKQKGNGNGD